ncbi:AraC family transcriptional regulator [Actinoplanes flavus]|uniref:AraC family transcriptional regulator n=1 Tax=Actinoplanes flavus TaxID=2820290 RepID=A0ABS3UZ66_9ACTN|nr:AraC family transcriptional regulator [Actinoplanes flavus]MBO3743862.1 AraC family transcriptional regulator [Actinoplanes flavus]
MSGYETDDGARPVTLHSSDLDETRLVLAEHFYSNFVDMLEPAQSLDTHLRVTNLGPVTIGDVRFGTDLKLRLHELGAYHVDVILSGRLEWQQGRDEPQVATDTCGALFQPVGDTVLHRWTGDCRLLAVKIDRGALETQLERMLDTPVRSPIPLSRQLDQSHAPGRTWTEMIRALAADALGENRGLTQNPLLAEHLQEVILRGLLLAGDHPYRERLATPGGPYPAPRAIRQAIDLLHSHPQQPITIAALADTTGVSERALQAGFQRYVGMSPTAYLRQVRLDRAHEELRRAAPGQTTVAAVAHRWGFTHLGRFANSYRARFGVSPSQTLNASALPDFTVSPISA